MNEQPPLPQTWQSILDEPTLRALFADIAGCTEVLDVRTKGGETSMSDAAGAGDLETLRDGLLDGRLWGVLIRYRHEDEEWWDTLTRTPEGIQLFRIQPPGPPPAGA